MDGNIDVIKILLAHPKINVNLQAKVISEYTYFFRNNYFFIFNFSPSFVLFLGWNHGVNVRIFAGPLENCGIATGSSGHSGGSDRQGKHL